MNRPRRSPTRRPHALPALLLAVTLAGGLLVACAPAPSNPTTTTTSTTTTTTVPPAPSAFCRIWETRAKSDPPARPFVYELDKDTVVHAREVAQTGVSCEDPGARILFHDGEIVGKDMFLPAHNSLDGVQLTPTPYSLTLAPGQAQAPSIEIATFNIQLSSTGIRIYGTLRATINGAVSTISFDGRFQDLQNFSVALDAPALDIPGLTSVPLSAKGSLVRRAGVNSFSFDAEASELQVADLLVRDVVVHLAASTTTGLEAHLAGSVQAAGDKAHIDVSASFDANGQLRDIDGLVDVALSSTQPNGDQVSLNGRISLSGQASAIVASFSGSGSLGADTISRAGGRAEITANGVVTVTGFFDTIKGGSTLHLEGSLVFDGSQGVPTLSAVAAGSFHGLTSTGEIVEVRGTVTITNTGGTLVTTVDGDLRVGALRGSATATVETNGTTTRLVLRGRVDVGTAVADAAGTIVFNGDGVESVDLSGALRSPVPVGKVSVDGTLDVTGGATQLAVELRGTFTGEGLSLAGSAGVVLDAQGRFVSLQAGVSGTLSQGDWTIPGFFGSLVADDTTTVVLGYGSITGAGLNYGQLNVSMIKSAGQTRLNAQGQGSLTSGSKTVFGDFSIVDNVLTMARVGLIYPPVVIDPERAWVRIRQGANGQCTNLQILDSTLLFGLFYGPQVAAADLACPVPTP